MGKMSDTQYYQRFQDWVERYQHTISPEELQKIPESSVGSPRILEHKGYKSSVLYIKNFALAKHISSLINIEYPSILEIGGGYGGVAEILMRLIPVKSYTIVDLPEVLPVSRYYLTQTHPDKDLHFLEPELMGGKQYDIVINTMSFGEMPRETAKEYIYYAMKHCKRLISHNSVKRTPSGVIKHSQYGFHNYRIDTIIAQPDVAGAFYDQHLLLAVSNGVPNVSAERLDKLQTYVGLGLHEDLNQKNETAMAHMLKAASASLFRNKHLKAYLKEGKSMLARAYAARLLGYPIEAPNYIKRALLSGSKRAVIRRMKKAL